MELVNQIKTELKSFRYHISDEKDLQSDLFETVLKKVGFVREFILEKGSIIDFYHPKLKIGIEVKISRKKTQIYRQCVRYTKSGRLDYLLLITAANVGDWFDEINNVPTSIIHLSRSLL